MGRGRALPGYSSPGVGFEQPFEMLAACHDRTQASLDLLQRLLNHVQHQGHDTQSRAAAADVLRYFDLAAPQHHADEERHVFPVLLQGGPEMQTLVQRLQSEHRHMESLWTLLRPCLLSWTQTIEAQTLVRPALDADFLRTAQAYAQLHLDHLVAEDRVVFPAARQLIAAPELVHMGREMQARRRL